MIVNAMTIAAVILTTAPEAYALASDPAAVFLRQAVFAATWNADDEADPALLPPPVAREFRGVWIATVANIDWPSRRGLSSWEQQAELMAILDRAAALNLNAVIFQVRPAGDALYQSSLEPWSAYLTGRMGAAPEPFYDPLAFAITEAHRRGLELHAWFNPYRARHPSDNGPAAANHISVRRPALVKKYGSHLWMDPGEPAVRAHTKAVILDVVRRYDVDGIHIDDYFYPYQERDHRGRLIPFPDDASWQRYRAAGGRMSRADWRRNNVDRMVEELYHAIRGEKPWVKFGVSPFGIWRPGNPPGVRGLDAYQEIYADALKWLRNGWLDYIAPQLYWRADAPQQPFDRLLAWWTEQNVQQRHVWPGLFTTKSSAFERRDPWPADEVVRQVELTREQPAATGHIHFSMRALMQNTDALADRLRAAYAEPALIPGSGNGTVPPPAAPRVELLQDPQTGGLYLSLAPGADGQVRLWVLWIRSDRDWRQVLIPAIRQAYPITGAVDEPRPDELVVTAVDRLSAESAPVRVIVPSRPGATPSSDFSSEAH